MSFWLKFVRDSNLSVNNSVILKYSLALADRFSTVDELLASDQNELAKLGVASQADRTRLITQARLVEEKVNDKSNLSLSPIDLL